MFRARPIVSWKIIEKEVIDEIIFTTVKPRNRLILELMARGGMRLGEALKLRSLNILRRSIPRMITRCRIPGGSKRANRRIIQIYQFLRDDMKLLI